MTEQPASQGATTTLPPQSANGTSPQLPTRPTAPRSGRMHTRIAQLLQIMRRDRRKPPAS